MSIDEPKRALVVRRGRQPHEVAFCIACLIVGLAGLIAPAVVSSAIERAYGDLSWLWFAGITLGALISLAGIARGTVVALLTERVGLSLVAGVCLAYAAAGLLFVGLNAFAAAAFVGGAGIASVVRVWQIGADLKRFAAALEDPGEERVLAVKDGT